LGCGAEDHAIRRWLCGDQRLGHVSLAGLLAYLVFKLQIGKEDEYLEKRFGQQYAEYRAKVSQLLPLPRRDRK